MRAVDDELNQRLERGDTELLDNPRAAFRLQALLNEDIRERAGIFTAIMAFLMVNAVTWLAWAAQGAYSSYTWQMTVPTTLVFLLPALALNTWRRARRNRRIVRTLSGERGFDAPLMKAKRTLDEETAYRLSDDGELVEYPRYADGEDSQKVKKG